MPLVDYISGGNEDGFEGTDYHLGTMYLVG